MSVSRSGLTEAEEAKAEVYEKRFVIGLSIAALVLFYFLSTLESTTINVSTKRPE